MKLTKNSELLISYFIKENCVPPINQTTKTKQILKKLYNDIKNGYEYIHNLKQKYKKAQKNFYNINIKKIHTVSQISKPQQYPPDSFPSEVRKHIDENTTVELVYTFSLYDKNIRIHFICEEDNIELKLTTYNKYVDSMLIWLYIINSYASKSCSKELTIYLYMTSLKKLLPESNIHILNETNVNTAFTSTCQTNSEIIIFRKEEWFKVFLHESFHNFGLDFSDMNTEECNKKILDIFPLKSDVNLYEAYCEFWSEIMNALFCSFFSLEDKNDLEKFIINSELFIHLERIYGFFQLVKILDFMGLSYKDLYLDNHVSHTLRENLYKEDTSVLSYYIINLILLNNYTGFLSWCDSNNLSILQFKKTISNQVEFCKFIEKNYKKNSINEGIKCTQNFIKYYREKTYKKSARSEHQKNIDYLFNNMRMTICELG